MEFLKFALLLGCVATLGVSAGETNLVELESNGDIECGFCQTFAEFLFSTLGQKETENNIIENIEKNFCPMLGKKMEECINTTRDLLPQEIEAISKYGNSVKFCELAGYCLDRSASSELMMTKPEIKSNNVECAVCKTVAEAVYDLIDVEETEEKIIDALDKVCDNPLFSLVPSVERGCRALVDTKLRHAIDLFLAGVKPEFICEQLDLCEGSSRNVDLVIPEVEENGIFKCLACEGVVKAVLFFVDGKKTEEKIIHALDSVCESRVFRYFPSAKRRCHFIVDQRLKQAIDYLLSEITPKRVCKRVHFC